MPKARIELDRGAFEALGLVWPLAIPPTAICVELIETNHSQQVYGSRGGYLGRVSGVTEFEARFRLGSDGDRFVTMLGDGQRWQVTEESYTIDFADSVFREPDPPPVSQAEAEAQMDELGAQLDEMKLP